MNKSKTKYVGKNVLRFEDERLLNGNGQYTADINFPGMYHVAFLRSEISHGEIISIDLEEAKILRTKGEELENKINDNVQLTRVIKKDISFKRMKNIYKFTIIFILPKI